jgi:hypothetical protein
MTTGANSYGSAADVAALTSLYTINGSYTTATIPTLANVEGWIDQVSATMNSALAAQGFVVPVTQADAVLAIKSFVVEAVTDLAHAANSAGRYYTDAALQRGDSPMAGVRRGIMAWVEMFAAGLGELGAARTGDTSMGDIGFRDTDNSGNATAPIFQRSAFGNTFEDWDK